MALPSDSGGEHPVVAETRHGHFRALQPSTGPGPRERTARLIPGYALAPRWDEGRTTNTPGVVENPIRTGDLVVLANRRRDSTGSLVSLCPC